MDPYLKEAQEKCNALEKIVKIQKFLINIQIILAFIIVCLVIFKNIFILKLFCLIPMFAISIISTILSEKARKLRNEILELNTKAARELKFMMNKQNYFTKGEEK